MWHYVELPEALRLPPCQHCLNRSRVTQVAPNVFVCGDCGAAFAAVWRSENRVQLADQMVREAAG